MLWFYGLACGHFIIYFMGSYKTDHIKPDQVRGSGGKIILFDLFSI